MVVSWVSSIGGNGMEKIIFQWFPLLPIPTHNFSSNNQFSACLSHLFLWPMIPTPLRILRFASAQLWVPSPSSSWFWLSLHYRFITAWLKFWGDAYFSSLFPCDFCQLWLIFIFHLSLEYLFLFQKSAHWCSLHPLCTLHLFFSIFPFYYFSDFFHNSYTPFLYIFFPSV